MKLAFVLSRYFPYGGLQRNFLRIAERCRDAGHRVVVYTLDWQGPVPAGFTVVPIRVRAVRNHARNLAFVRALQPRLAAGGFDGVVGFLKLPGLDIYYAADPCYQARTQQRGLLYKLDSRYRNLVALERAVFAPESNTEILVLSAVEQRHYMECYGTPAERFHPLPPGIEHDRMRPPDAEQRRAAVRRELGLGDEDWLLLTVGSDFRRKGLDRSLRALADLAPDLRTRVRLLVVGEGKSDVYQRLAQRLGVSRQLTLLGARDDVPGLLFGADLLLHPAYTENTGNVLLEAMVAGLPVLASGACGYAEHVVKADAGMVLPEPFTQGQLDRALARMLDRERLARWSANGVAYGQREDLYSRPEVAARLIVELLRRRG